MAGDPAIVTAQYRAVVDRRLCVPGFRLVCQYHWALPSLSLYGTPFICRASLLCNGFAYTRGYDTSDEGSRKLKERRAFDADVHLALNRCQALDRDNRLRLVEGGRSNAAGGQLQDVADAIDD